ncbi:MAG TPA: XrtA system polysaccharide deacetylase [Ignavibacteriaceae bacterium]|nr:XrtA system polysaccharide deacetylase [Ignavibacteriaceae bacterium]
MTDNQIVLTIDLEDWFHSLDYLPSNWNNYERRIEYGTKKILDLLEEKKSKATFFVLGDVAINHPQLIKLIDNEGHEIGSHGFNHKFIYQQTKEEFREDLRRSINYLSDLIGKRIVTFRAPYFSITKKSFWAFDILWEEGIKIDSSIFPVINHRYGIPDNPRLPYQLSNGLWEWPITTYKTFLGNIPFAGGVYFRFFPSSISRLFISQLQKKQDPIILYFHPWEFDPEQPKLKNLPAFLKLRHYHNLKNNFYRFTNLFEKINSISLSAGIKIIE